MPPNPPSKRVALPPEAPYKYPHFYKNILKTPPPPPPPRTEILDTPLYVCIAYKEHC